jgi:hypothetical protein
MKLPLDGAENSASRVSHFAPLESASDTCWTEGCVGLRVRLDAVEKCRPFRESITGRLVMIYNQVVYPNLSVRTVSLGL